MNDSIYFGDNNDPEAYNDFTYENAKREWFAQHNYKPNHKWNHKSDFITDMRNMFLVTKAGRYEWASNYYCSFYPKAPIPPINGMSEYDFIAHVEDDVNIQHQLEMGMHADVSQRVREALQNDGLGSQEGSRMPRNLFHHESDNTLHEDAILAAETTNQQESSNNEPKTLDANAPL
jgi:hypothetical protein